METAVAALADVAFLFLLGFVAGLYARKPGEKSE